MTLRSHLAANAFLVAVLTLMPGCSLDSEESREPSETTGAAVKERPKQKRQVRAFARPDPTNYVPNPSFERNLDFWAAYGENSLERDTGVAKYGRASAVAVATGLHLQPFGARSSGLVGYPRRGQRLTLSVWMKGDPATVGKIVRLQINETGGRAADAVVATKTFPLPRSWRRFVVRGRVRRNDRLSIDIYIFVPSSIARDDSFHFDDVSLTDDRTG